MMPRACRASRVPFSGRALHLPPMLAEASVILAAAQGKHRRFRLRRLKPDCRSKRIARTPSCPCSSPLPSCARMSLSFQCLNMAESIAADRFRLAPHIPWDERTRQISQPTSQSVDQSIISVDGNLQGASSHVTVQLGARIARARLAARGEWQRQRVFAFQVPCPACRASR